MAEPWEPVPVERLIDFGAMAKDVELLKGGKLRDGKTFPVATLGDLAAFGAGYEYRDIKGVGPEAADRLSEAELLWWGWWNRHGNQAPQAD